MNFQYLGTAAAEGFPAIFCNCPYCREAARLGGKNIRTRSQAIINEDLLLDFPPDTFLHKLQFGLDLTKVNYLVVTHKHMDHFYPQELTVRGSGYSHDMVSSDLHIFCAQETKDFYFQAADWEADQASRDAMHWHILTPFETVEAGDYRITALPACHMTAENQPFIYRIDDAEGKTVLYLHDSGYYSEEVWNYFASMNKPADLVSFDSTSGDNQTDHGHHMGIAEVIRVKHRMEEIGAIDDRTICVANHFSHNGHQLYEGLAKLAGDELLISYDGMKLTL